MRRILAIALVLTAFLPSIAFARAQYRCASDGRIREHCCCPTKHHGHAAPASAVTATSCCAIIPAHEAAAAPAVASARHESISPPPVTAAPLDFAAPLVPATASTLPPRGSGPPERGASLFVRHCALLL